MFFWQERAIPPNQFSHGKNNWGHLPDQEPARRVVTNKIGSICQPPLPRSSVLFPWVIDFQKLSGCRVSSLPVIGSNAEGGDGTGGDVGDMFVAELAD